MAYIRNSLKDEFCKMEENKAIEIEYISEITNINFELVCIERYKEILKTLLAQKEKNSTLEDDLSILTEEVETLKLSWPQRCAVILRSEKKKILIGQIDIIEYLQKVISETITLKDMCD